MKVQSYNTFWQRIHKSAKDRHFPLRVMFELTYRCNFFCKHCYVPSSYRECGELNTKEVFSILDQLADIGCFYLGFTGGEPFVREDIMDILWYARSKGFEIIIYSNGSLIDEKIANKLAELQLNKIDITIPGMSKEPFERISGVAGSRDRVFRAIELLHKKGVNLGFKSCVLKENESEIKDIQDFADSLGALHRLDDMLSSRLDGDKGPYEYRGELEIVTSNRSQVTRKNEVECELENHKSEIYGHREGAVSLFKCGVGTTQAAITPLGELKMCLMIDYPKYKIRVTGNKYQVTRNKSQATYYTLKEAWEKLKELVRRIKPDGNYQCNQCELEQFCKWCPAKTWLESRSWTSCEPESRKWAEKRIRNMLQVSGSK